MSSSSYLVVFVVLTGLAADAVARPNYPGRIPTPFSCSTCHISPRGAGPRNDFGDDFARANPKTWASVCAQDSDGDGFSNGIELGDPGCMWAPGDALPGMASRPGDPNDTPMGPERNGEINVSPRALDFGRVPGGASAEEIITITNIGAGLLEVSELALDGSADFSLRINGVDIGQDGLPDDPDGDGSPGLDPGQDFDVTVVYAPPVDGPDAGAVIVRSTDPEQPEVRVEMMANGASPCLNVIPPVLEISATRQGMTTTGSVTVESCGGEPVRVTAISFSDGTPAFAVSADSPNLPFELPAVRPDMPPPSRTILIDFTPDDAIEYADTLLIDSTDPLRGRIEVPVTGAGLPGPEPMPDAEPDPMPDAEPDPMPDAEPAPMPDAEPAPMPDAEPAPMPDAEPAPMPDAEPAPMPEPQPTDDSAATNDDGGCDVSGGSSAIPLFGLVFALGLRRRSRR